MDGAEEVHANHFLDLFRGEFRRGLHHADTRIGNGDVQPPPPFVDLLDGGGNLLGDSHAGCDDLSFSAKHGYLFRELFQAIEPPGDQTDMATSPGNAQCDFASDATGSTGDQADLSLVIHELSSLRMIR
jgi:hypothetical protein